MATDWYIEATTFGNCSCDYNCPCQFELRPTHGYCRGFEIGRIERGHFGDGPARRSLLCGHLCVARRDLRRKRDHAGHHRRAR